MKYFECSFQAEGEEETYWHPKSTELSSIAAQRLVAILPPKSSVKSPTRMLWYHEIIPAPLALSHIETLNVLEHSNWELHNLLAIILLVIPQPATSTRGTLEKAISLEFCDILNTYFATHFTRHSDATNATHAISTNLLTKGERNEIVKLYNTVYCDCRRSLSHPRSTKTGCCVVFFYRVFET